MLNRFIRYIQRYKGWFGGAAAICIFLGLYTGLLASPPDYYQGELVRIMYVHVPLAHTSTLAYSVLFSAASGICGNVTRLWITCARLPLAFVRFLRPWRSLPGPSGPNQPGTPGGRGILDWSPLACCC